MARSKSTKSLSGGCLALFGLPFLAAGLFLSGWYFSSYIKWWAAQTWVEVPCWIESAELKRDSSGDSDTLKALATYRYEFRGQVYHGDQVSLHGGSDNIGDFQLRAHRELARHTRGKSSGAERDPQRDTRKPFRCYVNPANPSESVIYRSLRWQMQAFIAIFALSFPAVGAGLVIGSLMGVRNHRREAALRELHPSQPWKWKTKWTETPIPESTAPGTQALIPYTIWSALVIFPLLLTAAMIRAFQTDPMAWLLLVFLAIWCIPAWYTLKRLRHRFAVGQARFELPESPVWPGGLLRGHVLLANPPPVRGDAEVTLFCEKSTTRNSGEDSTTTAERIWSHHDKSPLDRITRDLSGFRMPVSIALPADAPESGAGDDSQIEHAWKLEFKVPGTPIHSVFEIPVFRTGKSPAHVMAATPSISETSTNDLPALLAGHGIIADIDSAGMPVAITCPPARHPSHIVFLVIFNLIWTTAAVFLVKQKAPLVFQLVWPVSAGVIWLIVLWQILYKRTVTLTRDGLTVCHQLGPFSRTNVIEKSRIIRFSHDTNMTSNNTSFYRVRLEDTHGKKATLAHGISSSTTAGALVRLLDQWRKSG